MFLHAWALALRSKEAGAVSGFRHSSMCLWRCVSGRGLCRKKAQQRRQVIEDTPRAPASQDGWCSPVAEPCPDSVTRC